ncbi:hypothetical protein [Archaeoglobus veneficus]|uniref:ArnR1-like winged helix-turn-helix domain-containing protein n=1 Tax=Archaeoglobus veneficus (strain DSM 11195 / SNP6) TaxID=693661 RepID=F2KR88_ARCVS|nr:hypothetical protein [Archaeoglobus veneficus]AEA46725.1 hypothetical protein Arcve_0706 [Archaeoglobus veneficus SNP6]
MEELIGHITSNRSKIKVLEVLSRKSADIRTISKITRIPLKILEGVVKELEADGILRDEDGELKITERGLRVIANLKGI